MFLILGNLLYDIKLSLSLSLSLSAALTPPRYSVRPVTDLSEARCNVPPLSEPLGADTKGSLGEPSRSQCRRSPPGSGRRAPRRENPPELMRGREGHYSEYPLTHTTEMLSHTLLKCSHTH